MEIKLTDRIQLKEYFKKNKIPKESDFAEFIDASINQREDGIVKTPGDPLSIEATGDVAGVQKLMNFYRKLSDAAPIWSLNASGARGDKVVAGLDIASGSGISNIFIEEGTGKVGFGTTAPKGKLHVTEDVVVGNDADNQKFVLHSRSANGGDYLHIAPDQGAGWNWNGGVVIKRDGSVGIGTIPSAGKLHIKGDTTLEGKLNVNGDLNNSGSAYFGGTTKQMLNLWNTNYGIGVQSWTMYYRSDRNFSWYVGGSHSNDELAPGAGGNLAMYLNNGNLKVGSAQLAGTIQVINKEEDSSGTTFILGPTNGSNLRMGYSKEYSWIQSHGRRSLAINAVGNNVGIGLLDPKAKLHVGGDIAIGNDNSNEKFVIHSRSNGKGEFLQITSDDEKGAWDWGIGITLVRKSGNVGIGTVGPKSKLHVNGDILVDGYVQVQQQVVFNAYLATNDQSGEKTILPLKNVSVNNGDCFDIATSKFTAPVDGVYLFSMSMLCVTDENVHWYLMHNADFVNSAGTNRDESSERGLLSAYQKYASCSRTVLVVMKKGDTAHVRQGGGGRCDNFRSGLSGVLLYAIA